MPAATWCLVGSRCRWRICRRCNSGGLVVKAKCCRQEESGFTGGSASGCLCSHDGGGIRALSPCSYEARYGHSRLPATTTLDAWLDCTGCPNSILGRGYRTGYGAVRGGEGQTAPWGAHYSTIGIHADWTKGTTVAWEQTTGPEGASPEKTGEEPDLVLLVWMRSRPEHRRWTAPGKTNQRGQTREDRLDKPNETIPEKTRSKKGREKDGIVWRGLH